MNLDLLDPARINSSPAWRPGQLTGEVAGNPTHPGPCACKYDTNIGALL